jgi:hypothetical protein
MTPEKRKEIEELAKDTHQKAERVRVMEMRNVNVDPETKEQIAIDYAIATAEHFEAERILREAVENS